jgi:hypothetical protein
MTARATAALASLLLVAAGCASAASPSRGAAGSAGTDDAAARQYCTDKGGQLVDRVATWNTNADPSARLPLAGRMTFCEVRVWHGRHHDPDLGRSDHALQRAADARLGRLPLEDRPGPPADAGPEPGRL